MILKGFEMHWNQSSKLFQTNLWNSQYNSTKFHSNREKDDRKATTNNQRKVKPLSDLCPLSPEEQAELSSFCTMPRWEKEMRRLREEITSGSIYFRSGREREQDAHTSA